MTMYLITIYRNNELELHKNSDNNDLRKANTSMLNKLFSSSEENNGIMKPSRLWIETSLQETPSEEEYLFWGSGTVIMNENCANIFKQLNLGNNLLSQVQIFELETKKICRDNFFYILNICEERKYMLHQQSNPNLNYIPYPICKNKLGMYSIYTKLENCTIELNSQSSSCNIDLWKDPLLSDIFFISGNLYDLLQHNNLIDKFNPVLCKIIG